MNYEVNLSSRRARRARLGRRIAKINSEGILWAGGLFLVALSSYLLFAHGVSRLVYLVLAFTLVYVVEFLWYKYDLRDPAPRSPAQQLDDVLSPNFLSTLKAPLSPKSVWLTAVNCQEGRFMCNRLFINTQDIATFLSDKPEDMPAIWQVAEQMRTQTGTPELHAGTVVAAILTNSEPIKAFIAQFNLRSEDVTEVHGWLTRLLDYIAQPKPYFGGIGRDWATGFTPTLEHFSQNVSAAIEAGGGHFNFLAHADRVDAIVHDLAQGSGGVAIVGPTGTGKTSLVYGLAQRLLEGHDPGLQHYQVISLNASLILSSDKANLERLMLSLFGEATKAGNIILFLDEAQLFFGEGVGAFNMSQVLLPVLQSRRLKIIAAFTANDFQRLKATNEALTNSFSVISLNEPSPQDTMKILEDSALTLEGHSGLLVTYDAVREAFRLSGQYMGDQAYPGKAINLLDQSTPYAENKIMKDTSVQMAIEKTLGVKAGSAHGAEVDVLLQLEDRIHERMINQTQAVNAIAAALRRVRAGVTNPNRPAGSFLFLGPTGVGKTELAKSLAATYYGDEKQMIRLDMSEYQQPSDAARFLADGSNDAQSLIMAIRKQPFSVVLLDEVEKADPGVLNLLLQLLDEGKLTDQTGKSASFQSAIIIATSNAGATDIIQQIQAGSALENFERPLIDKLIQEGQFRPELVNRFDEVVLFRPLNQEELGRVAQLMIDGVNKNLAKQNIKVELTETALAHIVEVGYDPQFGARPMRHVIQKTVEDTVATRILEGSVRPGGTVTLDIVDVSSGDIPKQPDQLPQQPQNT